MKPSPRSKVLLGAQPIWNPRHWERIVRERASLRGQINRARNKNIVVEEWSHERATAHPALQLCLQQWLETRGLPPLHFLIEPQTLSRLFDRRIFVAEHTPPAAHGDTANAEVVGFVVLSPIPQRNGWLIEQIIRGHHAPNGTAEIMIDAAMRALAQMNCDYITLGLTPLSQRAGITQPQQPLWLQFVLAWIRAHGRRFYNFDGLDAFKAKFHPDVWEPIYAISNENSFSPGTLAAIAAAFTAGSPLLLVPRSLGRALKQEMHWLWENASRKMQHSS